jgi:hypothetical protein
MGFLHPSHAQPNDSAAAFDEYSHSQAWTYVHIGQFAGTLLVVITLVAIARSLSRQPGIPGALAVLGGVTAVLIAAVFAVQMAVDGVALKGTIDTHSLSRAELADAPSVHPDLLDALSESAEIVDVSADNDDVGAASCA